MIDYLTIDHNEHCWYNPDVGSTVKQLVGRRSYPLESYSITTEDGYINTVYRIPHNNTNPNSRRQPILLHAGFTGNAHSFLATGNRSLAFFLVNNGFDVWLSNRRGTITSNSSREHVYLSRSDREFWDFSFHECGYYDTKAEVDFIVKKTNQKVILLGYSMGTTETYIYAILRKAHATKYVLGIVSLSPIAFMKKSGGVIAKLSQSSGYIESLLRRNNVHVLYDGWEIKQTENTTLSYTNLLFGKTLLMYIAGYDPSELDPSDLPLYFQVKPSSSSVKTLVHFAQEVNAGGNFQFYDYGPAKNLILYNSTKPLSYNLSEIQVSVHLFYGENDLISEKHDVQKLYKELTVKNKSLTIISSDKKVKFNHIDFMYAKDIEKLLYKVLLKTIKENIMR